MAMILFKTADAVVPDFFKQGDDFTKRLAGNSSSKTISIKGGVWRMLSGGEEVARNEERAMNFVIINAAPNVSRVFYEGNYEEGKDLAPSCFSADGKQPDAASPAPQASSCANCPQNIAGSGQNNSRACRFNQRFAVVLEGDISGSVYRLQLPAKSLFGKPEGSKMPMQAYAKFLAGHNVPMSGVVTEARFDTAESVPVLRFTAVRPLKQEEWDQVKEQKDTDEALQAIEFKFTPKEAAVVPALPFAKEDVVAVEPPKPAAAAEPVKRASSKPVAPAAPKEVTAILDEWGTDDE